MNVYDFDHTIYAGDSSLDFYIFNLMRHPLLILMSFIQITAFVCIKCHLMSNQKGKELFFSFLKIYPPSPDDLQIFWKERKKKITSWYLELQKPDDLIISASPYFLLEPLVVIMLQKNLIATLMDCYSGKIRDRNCKGEEKIQKFFSFYPNGKIDNFYSDALSDIYLARVATQAFLVQNRKNNKVYLKRWVA